MTASGGIGTRPEARQVDVVEFWRLLELFSPQQVKKPDPGHADRPVVDWSRGRPLPWDVLAPPQPTRDKTGDKARIWQHVVYLGVYDLEAVYEHLHRVFPHDEDAHDERPGGTSACAALLVDADGRMVEDSAVLSSALWGLGRTVDPGVAYPGWSTGFDEAQDRLAAEFTERLAPTRQGVEGATGSQPATGPATEAPDRPRIDAGRLTDLVELATRVAGVAGLGGVATARVRIASTAVLRDAAAPEQLPDFLNSFLLDDLHTVATSEWAPALRQYLIPAGGVPEADRVDIRQRPEEVIAGTRVERLPVGRWLSHPDMHLATSQQFAVNEAFASLGSTATVMGVNGPPGTGKTTMLRDVLAGNVVRRAEALAAFGAPAEAFTATSHEWKVGDHNRRIRALRDEVTGFEMLLASSNNAAVQNVSDELPRRQEIHDPDGVADYFADLASEIADRQRTKEQKKLPPVAAWGLLAARLGNSANRGNFFSAFWFGKGPQTSSSQTRGDVVLGFQQRLKNWESKPADRPSWRERREAFAEARRDVGVLLQQRSEAQDRFDRSRQSRLDLAATDDRISRLDAELRSTADQVDSAGATLRRLESVVGERSVRYVRHKENEPGWLEKLFSRGTTREWRRMLVSLEAELAEAESAAAPARRLLDDLAASAARITGERETGLRTRSRLRSDLAALDRAVREDAATVGSAYPTAEWLQDDEWRELHTAWLDRGLDEARSKAFLAALRLHEAFWANVPNIRRDLQASLDVVSGAAPRTLAPEARRAAWQLLFLVVPLVSTTFASVGRMLHGLGPGALGWLLIDEAGQATPQAAVGAIWRAERVLAVGDPMQLTPVVTVPRRAQQDIAAAFSVDDEWVPSMTSVQRLADRVGRYGTTLNNGADPLWVSAPLRVHRRCDAPMFGICNSIAYEGLMIDGVRNRPDPRPTLPRSQWLDVRAADEGNHLQRAEIRRLRTALAHLAHKGVQMAEVIAVSPFRAVATALEGLEEDHRGLVAGTVHTAQGKEADVVFFVLGGDPLRPGAKRWASSAPNLVNVAVSRARHRLYVVGDRSAWGTHPFFDVLERALAEHEQRTS